MASELILIPVLNPNLYCTADYVIMFTNDTRDVKLCEFNTSLLLA